MRKYTLTATATIRVHREVRAKNKKEAIKKLNDDECCELVPLFYPHLRNYDKPTEVRVDDGAWFNPYDLDNQLLFK